MVGAARAVDEVLDAAVVFAVVVAVAGLVVADVDVVGLETTEVVATRAVVDVAATVDVVARSVVVGARRVVEVVGLVGTVARVVVVDEVVVVEEAVVVVDRTELVVVVCAAAVAVFPDTTRVKSPEFAKL